jgi:hypothetical protein
MASQGLLAEPKNRMAGLLGESVGGVLPLLAAAKAPQIAGGLLQVSDNLAAPRTLNPQTGAVLWHGSPHKFDKFDASKIGTGEGAQAYGHGLYLAESPGVAKGYADGLTGGGYYPMLNGKVITEDHPDLGLIKQIEAAMRQKSGLLGKTSKAKTTDEAIQYLVNKKLQDAAIPGTFETAIAKLKNEANRAKQYLGSSISKAEGQQYKVDLPDEHIAKMLDWDKAVPESQRAPISQAALKQFGNGATGTSGEHLYREVVKEFERAGHATPKDAATEWLRSQGVPGIRYLDGGSRGAGAGTSNYVVFPGNEGLLSIMERNGKPLK